MKELPAIVQKGDPVLRGKAALVPISEITTPKIKKIIANMKAVLATQEDGVAIAAPQIGVPLRIFFVSGFILKTADKNYKGNGTNEDDDLILINPEITKVSRTKQEVDEGCLSVRWLYGKMKRAEKVTIRAYDENGEQFERGASGLLAQIFQHENDHLNGILFTDNAFDIEEILPEDMVKRRQKSDDDEGDMGE